VHQVDPPGRNSLFQPNPVVGFELMQDRATDLLDESVELRWRGDEPPGELQ
jgi:hypothetical protein